MTKTMTETGKITEGQTINDHIALVRACARCAKKGERKVNSDDTIVGVATFVFFYKKPYSGTR